LVLRFIQQFLVTLCAGITNLRKTRTAVVHRQANLPKRLDMLLLRQLRKVRLVGMLGHVALDVRANSELVVPEAVAIIETGVHPPAQADSQPQAGDNKKQPNRSTLGLD